MLQKPQGGTLKQEGYMKIIIALKDKILLCNVINQVIFMLLTVVS